MVLRRVLMVSPHFPPDTTAGAHRVRLLAPHLYEFGWEPTVVTVDPRDYEGRLDPSLAMLLPDTLRVFRVRALPKRWTRLTGIGDLGIRSFPGLLSACRRLLKSEAFDCFFVTIYPSYTALLGPLLKRRFGVPFVLDYQDPWVGSWGLTTGPRPDGTPDWKSKVSRALSVKLEPIAVRAVDGISAVSEATFLAVHERNPRAKSKPAVAIPLGGEPADFEYLRAHAREAAPGQGDEKSFRLCYVGTLLPSGFETLRGFLEALLLLKTRRPPLFESLRVHFVGTSNQTSGGAERVLPEARRLGVSDAILEVPARIDYLDALDVLLRSDAILLLGNSERHYTASKVFPALLARRPLLAIFHRESSVVSLLERHPGPPPRRLVTYDDGIRAQDRVPAVYEKLCETIERRDAEPAGEETSLLEEISARTMARRLAEFLSRVRADAG